MIMIMPVAVITIVDKHVVVRVPLLLLGGHLVPSVVSASVVDHVRVAAVVVASVSAMTVVFDVVTIVPLVMIVIMGVRVSVLLRVRKRRPDQLKRHNPQGKAAADSRRGLLRRRRRPCEAPFSPPSPPIVGGDRGAHLGGRGAVCKVKRSAMVSSGPGRLQAT